MELIDRLHNCPNCGGTLWDKDYTCLYSFDTPFVAMSPVAPTGELSFTVVGDTIVEDTKITGSE